MMHSTRRSQ
jgi:hypothetical protein